MNLQWLSIQVENMLLSVFMIHLKLLTLLFHSSFLTLSPATTQLFVTFPQTPSTPFLPDTDVKRGKSDPAVKPGWVDAESGFTLVMGALFPHSPEGKGPCRRKPLGRWELCAETPFKSGEASSALWSLAPSCLWGGRQSRAGGSHHYRTFFSFHTCVCLTESHWCCTSDLFGWAFSLLWSLTHQGNEK